VFGNHLLGGKRLPGFQVTRANVLEKMLLNLVVERNDAVTIEVEGVHATPQLSRQPWCLYSSQKSLSREIYCGLRNAGARRRERRKGTPEMFFLRRFGHWTLGELAGEPVLAEDDAGILLQMCEITGR
jgi:hypothetical protein